MLLCDAQTVLPLTLSVPGGNHAERTGPLGDPNDRAVIVDTASAARSVKTSEREQLAKYKVPCCFDIEGFGGRMRAK